MPTLSTRNGAKNQVFGIQWEGPYNTIYNVISKRNKYGGIYKKLDRNMHPKKPVNQKRICVSLGKVDDIHIKRRICVSLVAVMFVG